MNEQCYVHSKKKAIGSCRYCGRNLCEDCLIESNDYYCCINDDNCLDYQEKNDANVTSGIVTRPNMTEEIAMTNALCQELRNRMWDMPIEKLLAIWNANDRQEWSDETFQVVRDILIERGIVPPEQEAWPRPQKKRRD